ncbi:type III-A CRISPR-associated RAMP protein Csm5 [Clostridium sp. Marseille-QA1073]
MIGKIIPLEIKTLSPTVITAEDSKKLSPYIDFILEKGEVVILDKDKITDILIEKEAEFNLYIDILKNKSSNSRDKFQIKDLLKRNHINLEEVTEKRIKCYSNKSVEISQCMKTRGFAFIPGSSLKGGIRTSILYHKSNKTIDERYINRNTGFKKTYVGEDFFRENTRRVNEDIFKNLIVRDTLINKNVSTAIYEIQNFNLYESIKVNESCLSLQVLVEAIDKNELLETEIILKNGFNKKALFMQINNFYEKVINRELKEINKFKGEEVKGLINQYNLLLDKIREFNDNNKGFLMRVGKLKGLFSNTINVDLNDDLLYMISNNKKKRKKSEFPTSKWIVSKDGMLTESLGWIEVKER